MARFCITHPEVKVDDKLELSNLFGEIKRYTFNDYNSTVKIYYAVKNNAKSVLGEKNLPLNSQGEATLEGILDNIDIRDFLGEKFNEKLKNNFKLHNLNYSAENYQNLLNLCEELNNSIYGRNYFATVEIKDDTIIPVVKYKPNNDSFSKEAADQARSSKLYNKILNILEKWGIKADVLSDAEERSSNGIVDFSSIEKASDNFYHVIRLAKGERGLKSLPEEFGHVIYKALKDSPLMQRTFNIIKSNNLQKEILGNNYEEYARIHNNNEDLITEEAVGKLIGIHFLMQIGIDDNAIYSSILGRNITNIKNFFSKLDESEISDAINEVNKNLSFIAKEAAEDRLFIDITKARSNDILHQIDNNQKRIDKLEKSLQRIIKNEEKRLIIYKNSDKTKEVKKLIRELALKGQKNDYSDGILLYMKESNKALRDALEKISQLKDFGEDLQKRSKYLRNYRNILYSYYGVMKRIENDLTKELILDDSMLSEEVRDYFNDNMSLITRALNLYNMYANDMVIKYWEPILGDRLLIDKGWFKKNPRQYTTEELLNMDVNDISWFDLWTDSMAHSGNYLLRGIDHIVKEKHNNARLRTIELFKKISSLTKDLEDSGIKNQDWMFERDKNGKRTGYYIKSIDSVRYNRERLSIPENMLAEWDKTHPIENYYTEEFKKLNSKQRAYYNEFIKLKRELDSLLPSNNKPGSSLQTIKIRKDLLERVKSSHSPKDAMNAFLTSLKEGYVRNSTETEFGIKSTIQDFEGFEYKELPVFYVNKSDDTSEEDISMDIVSTLTAYASMAYDNSEMMSIIDVLETTRSLARSADKPISQVGNKDEVDPSTNTPKRKESSNIIERMNAYYDMNIYKESKKDEGTIAGTKIDKGKAADRLMEWSSSITMAFNVLANISNVATGRAQILMEAVGGQFYNYKDMKYADMLLTKHIGDFVQDLTKKTKSSWLYTVCETFNSMQDYDQDIKHKDFDKKWFERIKLNGISMFLQQAGEFNMQNTTFFALLHSDKEALTDSQGNKIKVINSFTVEPIDKNHPDRGSEVVFKKGLYDKKGRKIVTKQELKERSKGTGKPFTDKSLLKENEVSEIEFINYISRKSASINQYLHGIYNEEDKAKMYSKGFGRLVGQYRKWIKPSINRRFAATAFNYDLDEMTEGSYRTLARFIGETIHELRSQQFNIVSRWGEMSDYEKANMRKVLTELSIYISVLIAISLIPDDDDDSWFADTYAGRMTTYQLYRLKNEIGALIPSTSMINEGLKILNSPMAGMNVIQKLSEATSSIAPWEWKQIKSGRYKGWYRPFNTVADLVPYNRAIYRTMHPEEGVTYYK